MSCRHPIASGDVKRAQVVPQWRSYKGEAFNGVGLEAAGSPRDLEDINQEFKKAEAIVMGANDTVNPAARTNKASPISGMPILNIDQAKQVYVMKRGQGKGYSGVENELFYADTMNLVYGDAQKMMVAMIRAMKSLEGGH